MAPLIDKLLKNGQAKIKYGLHMVAGCAQYDEMGKDSFTIFVNEATIRSMGPTFAGRPVFVKHVEEVDGNIDELRKEADGWVIESFFNECDGKHWVKFVTVTERADKAIAMGWRLSNAYFQNKLGAGGIWNGIRYQAEILGGEYEHLAIVPDPRYEESIILSPEEFKQYNEEHKLELKRLANEKRGASKMSGFSFFKKSKVDNSKDLSEMSVALPKSGKEVCLADLIKNADEVEVRAGEPQSADMSALVSVGDVSMKVSELVARYNDAIRELEDLRKRHDDGFVDDEEVALENAADDEDMVENAADDEEEKPKDKKKDKKENSIEEDKKEEVKERANNLRTAPKRVRFEDEDMYIQNERPILLTSNERTALGSARYGR